MVTLTIADMQAPFTHDDYLPFCREVRKKLQPDRIVQIGDLVDHHALADWDKDPDGMSAGDELLKSIEQLRPWYRTFPETFVCVGNHDDRYLRRAFKSGIPVAYLRDFREILKAPKGWRWQDRWDFDQVRYIHGIKLSGPTGALKSALSAMRSTVVGHMHSDAGILYWANEEKLIWGMNVGCGIDRSAYAFAYERANLKKPILSLGVVQNRRPSLYPMWLNKRGSWTGEL